MNQIDGLKRYLEAATTLTQITRGRAEEIVRDLVSSGELERTRAQEWIEDLLKRSRDASENFVSQVSSEVDRQLSERGIKGVDIEDLARRVAGFIELAGSVGRSVASPAARRAREEEARDHRHNGKKSSTGKTSQKTKQSGGKSSGKSSVKGTSAKKKTGGAGTSSKKDSSGKKGPKGTRPKKTNAEGLGDEGGTT